jgi:hypothetical protein
LPCAQGCGFDERIDRLCEREREEADHKQRPEVAREEEERGVGGGGNDGEQLDRQGAVRGSIGPVGDQGSGEHARELRQRKNEPDLRAGEVALDLEPARQENEDDAGGPEERRHHHGHARGAAGEDRGRRGRFSVHAPRLAPVS